MVRRAVVRRAVVRRAVAVVATVLGAGLLAACSGPPPAHRSGTPTTRAPSSTTSSPATIPPAPTHTTAPTTQQLADIAFFNPTDGYGMFTRQGAAGCQELVAPTHDGGATFGPLVQVATTCANPSSAGALAFDDHGDGFLYGPGLFVTHDGGVTWAQSPQPGAVLAVEALGLSVWMVESGCAAGAGPSRCALRLYESVDGGRTWPTTSLAPPGATGIPITEGAQGQSSLVRLSGSSAYMLTDPVTNPTGIADDAPLWFTSDGGRSWSTRTIPCSLDALSVVLSAAPDDTLFAVCAGQPGAGNQLKSALRSTNGGVSWTVESSCSLSGNQGEPACASATFSSGYLGGIDAVSASTVYLYGDRSSLLVTHDGGAHWLAVQPPIGDTADGSFRAIFFNASDGIVLADDAANNVALTLFTTTDGGARWTKQVPVAG